MKFFALKFVELFLALIIGLAAITFRTSWLAKLRLEFFILIIIISLGLILFESTNIRKFNLKSKKIVSFVIIFLSSLSLFTAIFLELNFQLTKYKVLHTNQHQLEKLGQHFIVGYKKLDEVKNLVNKKAIGGVFLTTRNIENRTQLQIKQEIQTLQTIRSEQGLPPLWITTDQEGGIVSRLSPPLTKLPQLSTLVSDTQNIDNQKDKIIHYAQIKGRELSEVGVNLNFAPVVDINKGIINPNDRYSQIYQRAISSDKEVVAKVAKWYCQTLEEFDVKCTIKHFPGLGRVETDTHIDHAELTASIEELTLDDWVPFREVTSNSQAFIMLGHAKLMKVDSLHPVSFSKPVVTEIIRNDWQYNGILVTDDFSMQAVSGSPDGLENATVKAINAGVDLILIAYDPDLYYLGMLALLKANKAGNLDIQLLEKSRIRLEQAR